MGKEINIKIHKIGGKIKEKMPEYSIDQKKLDLVYKIAKQLRRSELIIFWLQEAAKESENYFENWLKRIYGWSGQELINMIHELGPESIDRFIDKFKKQ